MPENITPTGSLLALRRKAARGSLDPVAQRVLDKVEPGWRIPALERRWQRSLRHLIAWRDAHDGQLPRQKGTHRDASERRAGDWMRTQKHDNTLSPERNAALDRSVPGWDVTALDLWEESKELAASWISDNGRLPATSAVDAVERKHAVWLRTCRSAAAGGRLDEGRREELDRAIPNWKNSRADRFRAIALEYAGWVSGHGRLPGFRTDSDQDETRLAAWLNNARGRDTKGRLTDDAAQCLDELVPDWRLTLTERMAARR